MRLLATTVLTAALALVGLGCNGGVDPGNGTQPAPQSPAPDSQSPDGAFSPDPAQTPGQDQPDPAGAPLGVD